MCTRAWPPGPCAAMLCADYAGPSDEEAAAAVPDALPYPGAGSFTLSSRMQLQLASATDVATSPPVNGAVQQAIATALRTFTVIDHVRASVRVWAPGASGASGFVYVVNCIFPTAIQGRVFVDGTPCPRVQRVDVPQVLAQCAAFAAQLDALLAEDGAAAAAVIAAANAVLSPYDTVVQALFTPFQCPQC